MSFKQIKTQQILNLARKKLILEYGDRKIFHQICMDDFITTSVETSLASVTHGEISDRTTPPTLLVTGISWLWAVGKQKNAGICL